MNFSIHQASHIGNRKFNQDRVAYAYNDEMLLLVLADGMGGHVHGEIAANMAIETFIHAFSGQTEASLDNPQVFLNNTMRAAHRRILEFKYEKANGDSPGTTCVAAIIKDDKLYFGHAGDSRLYVLRGDKVLIKTQDHSLVSHWVEWGIISAQEAQHHPQRNQITNCLGGQEDVFYMEMGNTIPLLPDDVILLASDGLWSPFSDEELAAAVQSPQIELVLDTLMSTALARETGHADNTTGLLMRWENKETEPFDRNPISHILEVL
ncbi:MAG: protein phosphatase 2C domain-containing protein [Gallionella sp.]|nr:protein phosphatase 2C domain-containing protein [Gallionella sp.]